MHNFNIEKLKEIGGEYTLTEIKQQPEILLEILELVKSKKQELTLFLNDIVNDKTRIIFTGAGTSEFVGNAIVNSFLGKNKNAVSIATTDIVSNIEEYISKDEDVLLVSFARSGNSPESIATFNMVSSHSKNAKHLIITCNKDGGLAKQGNGLKNVYTLTLPERSNDKSFAMTSSYTGMMMAAYLVFSLDELDKISKEVVNTSKIIEQNYSNFFDDLIEIANEDHKRIVFLGSGTFNGIAQESHLKVLELTAGEVTTFFNTPLGFRHGPKSILNNETIVFFFMNKDEYKRKYDFDLLKELYSQKQAKKIVVLDYENDKVAMENCDKYFDLGYKGDINLFLGIAYITIAQLYAFHKSLFLKKSPDNPWPSGLVNRVVQGVKIHKK
ncbi:SIS domain-containing protein [Spiroplasma endosymbiont of Othius punctulatus]|uniref:SIS domain-containing protein n=1 Tax=Spiroplasma endosymbiont of Othius punctulatus TaxID=3066289 RepID=UPI0030CB7679